MNCRFTLFLIAFALFPLEIISQTNNSTQPQKKIALVIGNGNYISGSYLSNPENDARAIKLALQGVGFTVMEYENLNQVQMKKAIDDFGDKLKNNDVGLFFYAGHGIQSKGYNYLIPIDAKLQSEQQVEYDCVQADRVLALMDASGSKVNILILDACRNNPFERSWTRSVNGSGLAFMNAPSGTLIAYATSPGKTASDGSGNNGLYTSAILESIKIPNITIIQMFQNVRSIVSQKSSKQQTPWESTSMTGDFYFYQTAPDVSSNLPSKGTFSTTPNVIPKEKQVEEPVLKNESSKMKDTSGGNFVNPILKTDIGLLTKDQDKNVPSYSNSKSSMETKSHSLKNVKLENFHSKKVGKQVFIYYDLTGTEPGQLFDIQFRYSTDNGKSYSPPIKHISGDAGPNIAGGINKTVIWDILAEQEKPIRKYTFKIELIPM